MESMSETGPRLRGPRRGLMVAGVSVALVLACGSGGYVVWDRHETASAKARCDSAYSSIIALPYSSDSVRRDRGVSSALAVGEKQVSDAGTVTTLKRTVDRYASERSLTRCTAGSRRSAGAAADAMTADLARRRTETADVSKAVRAVVASRAAKSLADARAFLASALDGAQGTLDSSKGRVADENTRTVLSGVLAAARKVAGDKSVRDPGRLDAARKTLDAPVRAVNDSVARKAADDRAKADAARAASAAQQTQPAQQSWGRSSYGSSGYSTRPRGSSGSSTGGGGSRSATPGNPFAGLPHAIGGSTDDPRWGKGGNTIQPNL